MYGSNLPCVKHLRMYDMLLSRVADPDPTSQDKPDPDPDPISQDNPDPDPDTSVLKIFHQFYDEF